MVNPEIIASASRMGLTHEVNQDRCAHWRGDDLVIGLVADGVGGHTAGERASALTVDTFVEHLGAVGYGRRLGRLRHDEPPTPAMVTAHLPHTVQWMEALLRIANDRILAEASTQTGRGMASTAVVAIADRLQCSYHLCHVGDSRAYSFARRHLKQLTRDHVKPPSAANARRNIVTRALGAHGVLPVEVTPLTRKGFPFAIGDLIMMCTDGLSNMVTESVMLDSLNHCGEDLGQGIEQMMLEVERRKGGDDATALVLMPISRSPRPDSTPSLHIASPPPPPPPPPSPRGKGAPPASTAGVPSDLPPAAPIAVPDTTAPGSIDPSAFLKQHQVETEPVAAPSERSDWSDTSGSARPASSRAPKTEPMLDPLPFSGPPTLKSHKRPQRDAAEAQAGEPMAAPPETDNTPAPPSSIGPEDEPATDKLEPTTAERSGWSDGSDHSASEPVEPETDKLEPTTTEVEPEIETEIEPEPVRRTAEPVSQTTEPMSLDPDDSSPSIPMDPIEPPSTQTDSLPSLDPDLLDSSPATPIPPRVEPVPAPRIAARPDPPEQEPTEPERAAPKEPAPGQAAPPEPPATQAAAPREPPTERIPSARSATPVAPGQTRGARKDAIEDSRPMEAEPMQPHSARATPASRSALPLLLGGVGLALVVVIVLGVILVVAKGRRNARGAADGGATAAVDPSARNGGAGTGAGGVRTPRWIDSRKPRFEAGYTGDCPAGAACFADLGLGGADAAILSRLEGQSTEGSLRRAFDGFTEAARFLQDAEQAFRYWQPSTTDEPATGCKMSFPDGRPWVAGIGDGAAGLTPLGKTVAADRPYRASSLARQLTEAVEQGGRRWDQLDRELAGGAGNRDPLLPLYRDRIAAAMELGLSSNALPDHDLLLDSLTASLRDLQPLVLRLPSDPLVAFDGTGPHRVGSAFRREVDALAGIAGRDGAPRFELCIYPTTNPPRGTAEEWDSQRLTYLRDSVTKLQVEGRLGICREPLGTAPPPTTRDDPCVEVRAAATTQTLLIISP